MRCCHKRKAPLPEASSSIGAAYRIPRIRCADPHRLRPPAGALARGLKTLRVFFTPAPRPRFESMRCCHKRKSPRCRRLSISIGAAYRIRTYDVLIRSQTLYPAEVTPQRKIYKTTLAYWSQAQSQTFLWNAVLSCCSAYTAVPCTIDWLFDHVKLSIKFPQERSHPLGTIIIGKRDAQHASNLIRCLDPIEML